MSKHTEGPWRLHASADVEPFHIGISAKNHELMAQVVVQMDGDELQSPELVANARLIAAAPELLQALQEAYEDLKYLHKARDADYARPDTEVIATVAAAIAKATGEA